MSESPKSEAPRFIGPIFDTVAPAALDALGGACTWSRHPARTRLVSFKDWDNDVLFVESGRVRVTMVSADGQEVILREIGPGGVFGDYSAIDGLQRSADVLALDNVCIGRLPGSRFIELLHLHPSLMLAEMRSLTASIRMMTDKLYELSTQNVQQRIHAYLLRRARAFGSGSPVTITRLPTHEDIAAEICTRREAISREMAALLRQGLIRRDGEGLVVDVDALERLLAP